MTLFIVLQLAGLAAVGQDYYGVFPLRGKLLNVREATAKQLTENKEIGCIKQSLGLQQHKEYTNVKSLRYGHLMRMTDQVRLTFLLLFCSCFMLQFSLQGTWTAFNKYKILTIILVQDHDGSHIKGLLINFIHSYWPSLLKVPSFLIEFITPIVKVGIFS